MASTAGGHGNTTLARHRSSVQCSTPTSAKSTRVVMEHRNLDRYGAAAASTRASIDSPDGWGAIMDSFARVAGEYTE
ncbi:MAG: hypothetical protein JWM95_972 [Gemmatimonadetes bacterium]|nr:hypothetical protein [Gemmatimonadota bacterium]